MVEERIALLTDSTGDLNQEDIEKYAINVLPLKVVYADRQYDDRVDITPEEVYATLDQEPKTSVPTPYETQQVLNRLREEGFTHVLAVHISSGLSGTAEMVRMVAREVEGLTVEVIDSRSLSMGLGFIVLQAARWVEEKMPFDQLVEKSQELVERIKVFFVVETLEYLIRGGRIGKVQGTLGDFLNVKPIISINEEGIYYTYKKIRGRKRSLEELFNIAKGIVASQKCRVAVMHGAAQEQAQEIMAKIQGLESVVETVTGQIGPVIGVHTGPGLLGIAICPAVES